MATDHALLDLAAERGVALLRLYRWDPPCLSLGRHEPVSRYPALARAGEGVRVVRRPTGGRAVRHGDDLTYALAMPADGAGAVADVVRRVHATFAAALARLGLDATPADAGPAARPDAGPCFARPAGGELLVGGRKVLGSAQVRERGALLQHGALLLSGDQREVADLADEPPHTVGATSLAAAAGRDIPAGDVAAAVVAAFAADWSLADAPPDLQAAVAERARGHEARYRSPAWTWDAR